MKKESVLNLVRLLVGFLATVLTAAVVFFISGTIIFTGPSKFLSERAAEYCSETQLLRNIPLIWGAGQAETSSAAEESVPIEPTEIIAVSETPEPTENPVKMDAYGLVDDDGDGIIYQKIPYKGSTVYLLTILDPTRVFVGTCVASPDSYGAGKTLDVLCEEFDAVGGINAGGFQDDNGGGGGWPPLGIVYSQGECYWDEMSAPIAALDKDGVLHVGWYTYEDCEAMGVTDAVSFGPILIENGIDADSSAMEIGINPRTAIGQREDGAIVLMAVDGRQAYSIGVSYPDCITIMKNQGCINAVCMDGGNSTSMYFEGELMNHPANQAGGTRYLPDAWLIRR